VQDLAPCLYSIVPARIRTTQTVAMALPGRLWARSFSGGMSTQAIIDYLHLWHIIRDVELSDQEDTVVWRWTPDGSYNAKSAYLMLHAGSCRFAGHRLIWKTWAPLKIKIFLWLAFRRRHWTADRRRRHGLKHDDHCYLCDQVEESIDHIVANCPFTTEVWFLVLQALGLQLPQPAPTVRSWWRRLRFGMPTSKQPGMDSLFTLVSWQIWKNETQGASRMGRRPSATSSLSSKPRPTGGSRRERLACVDWQSGSL
jgi:hypothetical protein